MLEKYASLTELEVGFLQGIISKYMLHCWK